MNKQSFPVISAEIPCYPDEACCPVCGEKKVWEPHSMVELSVGALKMNRRKACGMPSDKLDGFFRLTWHGAHDNGEGDDREIDYMLSVIEEARGGCACIYFCSTKCLRFFFNACVDELESGISLQKEADVMGAETGDGCGKVTRPEDR